jgi:hypothetical protein
MIVMVESGRLGNQIFQFLALKEVARPGERLVLFGFDQLRTVFDGADATYIHIYSNPLKHLVSLDVASIARRTERLHVAGVIREGSDGAARRQGVSYLALTEPAWFQSEAVLRGGAAAQLRVRPTWLQSAQDFLSERNLDPRATIAVHVRAGDYRHWPSSEAPAILSPEWYRRQVEELRSEHPEFSVVAVGDDPAYTNEVLHGIERSWEFTAAGSIAYAPEFALMTLCSRVVLSASSFAYWGAYFASLNHPGGRFIGPNYWAGHASGAWYPAHIRSGFIDYR